MSGKNKSTSVRLNVILCIVKTLKCTMEVENSKRLNFLKIALHFK